MSRRGEVFERGEERFFFRVRLTSSMRPEFRLHAATTLAEAEEIGAWMASLVDTLVEHDRAPLARNVIKQAAACRTKKGRRVVEEAVRGICDGSLIPKSTTFRQFATRWVEGDLHRIYPDHVRAKDSKDDASRLKLYIYPLIGDLPLSAFEPSVGGLAHCERVMAKIPDELERSTRRHVAQILNRVLGLAVYPARLLTANPLPKGFLPKVGKRVAKTFLYPDEGRLLSTSERVPEMQRLAFGVLAREGMRVSELVQSDWWQWDLARGTFTLDENKTDDPRMWALLPDVVRAVKFWKHRGPTGRSSGPFAGLKEHHLARLLRAGLKAAGVKREELFMTTEARHQLRAHDLRATFITLALAANRSEQWVADRTGHKSSSMIQRYRRPARTAAELGLGEMGDLAVELGWDHAGPHVPPCDGAPECTCARLLGAVTSDGGSGPASREFVAAVTHALDKEPALYDELTRVDLSADTERDLEDPEPSSLRVGGSMGGSAEEEAEEAALTTQDDSEARIGFEPTYNGFAIPSSGLRGRETQGNKASSGPLGSPQTSDPPSAPHPEHPFSGEGSDQPRSIRCQGSEDVSCTLCGVTESHAWALVSGQDGGTVRVCGQCYGAPDCDDVQPPVAPPSAFTRRRPPPFELELATGVLLGLAASRGIEVSP